MSTFASRVTLPVALRQVARHDGPSQDFLRRYQALAGVAVQNGQAGIQQLAPRLLDYASDERNLRAAWDHLARYGGPAPGPDGHRFTDYSEHEIWSLVRAQRNALRSGTYQPGGTRPLSIPKSSGNGYRTLRIPNIEDKVVARGMMQILGPIFDPRFDANSFGFRPNLGRAHALARVESVSLGDDRLVWIVDDVRNAFDMVPRPRLEDVLRMTLPEEMVKLAMVLIRTDRKQGVAQGNPLSALMLNVYLDHFLDQPWRRQHPDVPLIRTADDILVCCQTVEQAREAYPDLQRILNSAAMPLKGNLDSAVHDLRNAGAVDWLGYQITLMESGLRIRIGEKAWTSLTNKLDLAHEKPISSLVARQSIKGWIRQMGPCYEHEDRGAACNRIWRLANDRGFEEAAHPDWLLWHWQAADRAVREDRERRDSTERCPDQQNVMAENDDDSETPF